MWIASLSISSLGVLAWSIKVVGSEHLSFCMPQFAIRNQLGEIESEIVPVDYHSLHWCLLLCILVSFLLALHLALSDTLTLEHSLCLL